MLNLLNRLRLKRMLRNQFESKELRDYFFKQYQIQVGMYSYGCFDSVRIAKGTQIGRYCSVSSTAYIFNGNHGLSFLTLHPYVYNTALGLVKEETILRTKCVIEDDVWLGHNSIITPNVTLIGRGAVVAAGAVVTKNVPPYSVVAGNPAKVIKYRFEPNIIAEIEKTQWWLKDVAEIKQMVDSNPSLIFSPAAYFNSSHLD